LSFPASEGASQPRPSRKSRTSGSGNRLSTFDIDKKKKDTDPRARIRPQTSSNFSNTLSTLTRQLVSERHLETCRYPRSPFDGRINSHSSPPDLSSVSHISPPHKSPESSQRSGCLLAVFPEDRFASCSFSKSPSSASTSVPAFPEDRHHRRPEIASARPKLLDSATCAFLSLFALFSLVSDSDSATQLDSLDSHFATEKGNLSCPPNLAQSSAFPRYFPISTSGSRLDPLSELTVHQDRAVLSSDWSCACLASWHYQVQVPKSLPAFQPVQQSPARLWNPLIHAPSKPDPPRPPGRDRYSGPSASPLPLLHSLPPVHLVCPCRPPPGTPAQPRALCTSPSDE
jgi:hypothetical protein